VQLTGRGGVHRDKYTDVHIMNGKGSKRPQLHSVCEEESVTIE
jgi:hypothetical protein